MEKQGSETENVKASKKNKIILVVVLVASVVIMKVNSGSDSDEKGVHSSSSNVLGIGVLVTDREGVELGKVNLWTSTDGNSRTIACTVVKGQKLKVTGESGPYYYVEAIGRTGCEGYCMKEFVKMN